MGFRYSFASSILLMGIGLSGTLLNGILMGSYNEPPLADLRRQGGLSLVLIDVQGEKQGGHQPHG